MVKVVAADPSSGVSEVVVKQDGAVRGRLRPGDVSFSVNTLLANQVVRSWMLTPDLGAAVECRCSGERNSSAGRRGDKKSALRSKFFLSPRCFIFFLSSIFFSLSLRQVQMMGPQGSIWGLFLSFFCVHLCLIMCIHWCTRVMLCRSCLHRWIFPRRCRCRYSGLADEAVRFSHT